MSKQMNIIAIGARFRWIRHHRVKVSRQRLAKILNVLPGDIRRFEQGRAPLPSDMMDIVMGAGLFFIVLAHDYAQKVPDIIPDVK